MYLNYVFVYISLYMYISIYIYIHTCSADIRGNAWSAVDSRAVVYSYVGGRQPNTLNLQDLSNFYKMII